MTKKCGVGGRNLASGSSATLCTKQTVFLNPYHILIFQLYFKYEVFYPEGDGSCMKKLKWGTILVGLGPSKQGCTIRGWGGSRRPDENCGFWGIHIASFYIFPRLANQWVDYSVFVSTSQFFSSIIKRNAKAWDTEKTTSVFCFSSWLNGEGNEN